MAAEVTTSAVGPMVPVVHRVVDRRVETIDTVTLTVAPRDDALDPPAPGQFFMLWAFGVGEAPVSVSGEADGAMSFTIRAVGAVTRALAAAENGDEVGLRGPFGVGWSAPGAERHTVIVAGGLGLAPVRPLVRSATAAGAGEVSLLLGARSPDELLYAEEIQAWAAAPDLHLEVTVDTATPAWRGEVGTVTRLVERIALDPGTTVAAVCGPEVMMRAVAGVLVDRGVDARRVEVSLERNMHCAIGHCGHCQLADAFVCKDGPVLGWDRAAALLEVRAR